MICMHMDIMDTKDMYLNSRSTRRGRGRPHDQLESRRFSFQPQDFSPPEKEVRPRRAVGTAFCLQCSSSSRHHDVPFTCWIWRLPLAITCRTDILLTIGSTINTLWSSGCGIH